MFWDIIQKLCKENNTSANAVCAKLGFSTATATHWKRGANPKGETLSKIADYFNVSVDYLLGKEEIMEKDVDTVKEIDVKLEQRSAKVKLIPLIGDIACGQPIFAYENYEDFVAIPDFIKADFCLKARGNSMINARIYDGDIVLIKKCDIVENGDVAAVIIDDTATLKRFYFYPEQKKLLLMPENSEYEPIMLVGHELESVRVLGKAVNSYIKIK